MTQDAQAFVEPILVEEAETGETGVIFEVVSRGVGSNFSMAPGYVSSSFFAELSLLITEREIRTKTFRAYMRLREKGVPDQIAASIPLDELKFREYVDSLSIDDQFVGVWQTDGGEYTLGMVRDEHDSINSYKMFVIDSRFRTWSPGEIKVKFIRLDSEGLATARYLGSNKAEVGLTFESTSDLLVSINSPFDKPVILIKTYPTKSHAGSRVGSGTGWHLGDDVFVTNAHVVDGAKEIEIHAGSGMVSARVLAIDLRLDLAVLKASKRINLAPIPIGSSAVLGEQVTVIGYPLGRSLGLGPKVTDGLLSGTEGTDADATRYLISAPIQPGNSGGPVFNDEGQVIGIAVSKLVSEETDNVSFAIKAGYLRPLLDGLDISLPAPSTLSEASPKEICAAFCASVVRVETR